MGTQIRPSQPTSIASPAASRTGRAQGGASSLLAQEPAPQTRGISIGKLWRQATRTFKGQVITLGLLIVVLSLIQAIGSTVLFRRAYESLGQTTTTQLPRWEAAQVMRSSVGGMDAAAAAFLAAGGDTALKPCAVTGSEELPFELTVRECADLNLSAEITRFSRQLALADRNVSDARERTIIDYISTAFDSYVDAITVMRYEHRQIEDLSNSSDPRWQTAQEAYLRSSEILYRARNQSTANDVAAAPCQKEANTPSLPLTGANWPLDSVSINDNLTCLTSLNKPSFDTVTSATTDVLASSRAFAIAFGILLCGVLLLTAWRLARITHRVFHAAIWVALLTALVYSTAVSYRLSEVAEPTSQFNQALNHSATSTAEIAGLKQESLAARAAAARWLVAKTLDDGPASERWDTDWRTSSSNVQTRIGRQESTWDVERETVQVMRDSWAKYIEYYSALRNGINEGSAGDASPTTQFGPGNLADQAFDVFSQTVERLSSINQSYQDQAYTYTESMLRRYIFFSWILFVIVGGLATFGIYRRLKEF